MKSHLLTFLATIAIALPPCRAARNGLVKTVYRTPLSEVGQSGVCLHGERLFLTVHKKLSGPLKDGFYFNGDIVGQCFEKKSGRLLWEVELPGTNAGRVLESWHDSTSLLPVADDKHVVFHNLNGMLGCYTHDGKLVWKRTWQAPDPDIKNCRMFLKSGALIVSLTSERIAVPASDKHPQLPFYQIHSLDVATGKDNWTSPVLLTHATQYSLDQWKGEPVIVASMIDLSHWKFGQGRKGYLLSLRDGTPLLTFELPAAVNPHQKNQLCRGKFVATVNDGAKTRFQLVDPESGTITQDFRFEKSDQYFAWTGERHQVADFVPEFTNKILKGKGMPTPSTVHVVGERIYFWRYDSGDIGCIDTKTGKSVLVEAPLQCLRDRTIWNSKDIQYTKGIFNSSGTVVSLRFDTVRGITQGGFGHTNPLWPARDGDRLYWQAGSGVLHIIDVSKPFGPDAFSWKSIDSEGKAWTFGEPGCDEAHIYVRSQIELVKFAMD